MAKFHGVLIIVWCIIYSSHHTLIVTEKEDGESSNTVDCYEKTSLLQPMDDIAFRNEVHDRGNFADSISSTGSVRKIENERPIDDSIYFLE